MNLPGIVEIPLRFILLLAGLLVPGSMLLRALRLPWSLAAAFVTSAVTLYVVVLIFACTGITISLFTLTVALGLVAAAGRLVSVRRTQTQLSSSFASFTRMGYWTPLYLGFWAIVAYRLVAQPLAGPEVPFRWSWLAEEMLRFGSLDFYPPLRGDDFVRYFRPESIPPGIASVYAWAYGCGGSMQPLWTSPVIALQILSLHEVIWRLGRRWGGDVVARRAVLLAAACPLLTWSFLLGQESGPVTLSVCGLVWCLFHLRETDGNRWAVLAGIFALSAASTREYGPVFALAAVGGAWFMRASRRQIVLVASLALPVVVAWTLRVWIRTGNPVYSFAVFGLFPTNPVFNDWLAGFRGQSGSMLASLADWQVAGRAVLLWALPAAAGFAALLVLLFQRLKEAQIVAVFVGLIAGLWLAHVAGTTSGMFYSLRVLGPAFALLALVASYGLAVFVRHPEAAKYAALGVALIGLESLPKTLVLPENPYRLGGREWLQAGRPLTDGTLVAEQKLRATLTPLPGRRRILTDDGNLPRVLAAIGTEAAPLWSPQVAWLFDERLKPAEIARCWRLAGMRYLVLSKTSPAADFMRTHARWRAPYFTLKTVAETETHLILEATAAAPTR